MNANSFDDELECVDINNNRDINVVAPVKLVDLIIMNLVIIF